MLSPGLLRHVVEAATMAPSVRSTQPWLFLSGDDRLELYADLSRRIEDLDPDGRQLHISCGAALFHARVAARALGLDADVELLPDPVDVSHLATIRLAWGAPATADEAALATAILQRHARRDAPLAGRPLSPALVERLRLDVEREGAVLRCVSDNADVLALELVLGVPVDGPADRDPDVVVLTTPDDGLLSWLAAGQGLAALLLRAADHGVLAHPLGQVADVVRCRAALRGVLHVPDVPQLVMQVGYAVAAPVAPRRAGADISARPAVVRALRVAG